MNDKATQKNALRFGIIIGAFIIYMLCFFGFSRFWGLLPGIGFFALVPLTAFALLYGFKGGLLFGLIIHPMNVSFMYLLGAPISSAYFGPRAWVAWVSAIIIGMGAGYMRDINLRSRKALEDLGIMNRRLQTALDEIRTLSGLLPVCAHCKNVRDDQGYWQQIEAYIQTHSDAEISHSICPACVEELYPDIDLNGDAV